MRLEQGSKVTRVGEVDASIWGDPERSLIKKAQFDQNWESHILGIWQKVPLERRQQEILLWIPTLLMGLGLKRMSHALQTVLEIE